MNRSCDVCHVVFWKDPGEALGAMYVDFAVASGSFLLCWAILVWTTALSDTVQLIVLSAVAVTSFLACYPLSRSVWTMLVYLSGGITRPPLKVVGGGRASRPM